MAEIAPADVARAMAERDAAARHLSISIENCAEGTAEAKMVIQAHMLNAHTVCHGGFIFTLADTAFAYACNASNINTVASGCTIEFLAPVFVGDVLRARAQARVQRGRQGIYDVDVHNQKEELVAVFRGKSARITGNVITPEN